MPRLRHVEAAESSVEVAHRHSGRTQAGLPAPVSTLPRERTALLSLRVASAALAVALLGVPAMPLWAQAAPASSPNTPAYPGNDGWRIETVRPAQLQAPQRTALCDFAKLAAQQQALPMADDPVFRPPTPDAKAQLGRTRKAILSGDVTGEAQLQALLGGPEGPTLARLALQDRDLRVQVAAAKAAVGLASLHPRLFAFVPGMDRTTPANLALALVNLDFATGCDTPILYALDALDHPAAEVVEQAIRKTAALAARIRSPAPVDRVAAWLERRGGPPRLRLLGVRLLGGQGLVHLTGLMARLSNDPDAAVAGEARVGWARLAPGDAAKHAAGWWQDRRACAQVAALRATAELAANNPADYLKHLQQAARNSASCIDPLTNSPRKVSEVAQQVLVYWESGQ